jgi:hypothetical protein
VAQLTSKPASHHIAPPHITQSHLGVSRHVGSARYRDLLAVHTQALRLFPEPATLARFPKKKYVMYFLLCFVAHA